MNLLFIDLTTNLDSVSDLESRARGGMVSSLHILPNALQSLGHRCLVMSDVKQPGKTKTGVLWINDIEEIVKVGWDFLILNRQIYGDGFPEIKARHRILWTHDMVHGGWIPDPDRATMLSAVVFMSNYSERTWRSYYKKIGRSAIIPNGVDKQLFRPQKERDLNHMIYFSAPNRGLEHLPVILDTVRDATGRDIKCTAFSKMSTLHPQEGDDRYQKIYDAVKLSDVDLREPVPQAELAKWVSAAGLMVKPNDYAETCSNSTLQALASGTPVVTSPVGADKEWVKNRWNGYVTFNSLNDGPVFILETCRAIVDIMQNGHERLIDNAPKTENLYSWEEIGHQWNKMLNRVY